MTARGLLSLLVCSLAAPAFALSTWDQQVQAWRQEAPKLKPEDLSKLPALVAQGDLRATYLMYLVQAQRRFGESKDWDRSKLLSSIEALANANHPIGQRMLCYQLDHDGRATPAVQARAVSYCQRAADVGFADAMVALGSVYESGYGGRPRDLAQALRWFEQGGEAGEPSGWRRAGLLYERGQAPIAKDVAKAERYFVKASEAGDHAATVILGARYRDGQGVVKDEAKALSLFQRAVEQGSSEANSHMGYLYEIGAGVPKNLCIAKSWYDKAAALNEAWAWRKVAGFWFDGQCVEKDLPKAFQAYKKAAELGEVVAKVTLGWLYERGYGTARNTQLAVDWYQKAADLGNVTAMANLGYVYSDGINDVQDDEQALAWWQKAAALGDAKAKASVADFQREGRGGLAANPAEAARLYREAATAGSRWAMFQLGKLLIQGEGLAENRSEGMKWLNQARAAGLTESVDLYLETLKSEQFALALAEATERLRPHLDGLPASAAKGERELKGAESPQAVLRQLSKSTTTAQLCSQGLVSDRLCNLQRFNQQVGGVGVHSRQEQAGVVAVALQARLPQIIQGYDERSPIVQSGTQAVTEVKVTGDRLQLSLADPSSRPLMMRQGAVILAQTLGDAMAKPLGPQFKERIDAVAPQVGAYLVGPLDAVIARYGQGVARCAATIDPKLDLETAMFPGGGAPQSTSGSASYVRCTVDAVNQAAPKLARDVARVALEFWRAYMSVYGPKDEAAQACWNQSQRALDTAMNRFDEMFPDLASLVNESAATQIYRRYPEAWDSIGTCSRGPLSEQLQAFGGVIDKLIQEGSRYIQRDRLPAGLMLVGARRFMAGQATGFHRADQFIDEIQQSTLLQLNQLTSAKLVFKQVSVRGLLSQKQAWILDDVQFPALQNHRDQ